MGYHVAIVKTEGSVDSVLNESEINTALRGDSDYSFDGVMLSRRGKPFLQFSQGELWLQNPGESQLQEMLVLASRLKARVRGDESETYSSVSQIYAHPDDKELRELERVETKKIKTATKKRQWILNASLFGFFVLIISVFKVAGWLE